jgi:hypothetical protein
VLSLCGFRFLPDKAKQNSLKISGEFIAAMSFTAAGIRLQAKAE